VPAGTAGALAGRVVERRYAGSATFYQVELPGTGLEIEIAAGAGAAAAGDPVAVAPAGGQTAAAGRIFRRTRAAGPEAREAPRPGPAVEAPGRTPGKRPEEAP
jgi:hypothetical protein